MHLNNPIHVILVFKLIFFMQFREILKHLELSSASDSGQNKDNKYFQHQKGCICVPGVCIWYTAHAHISRKTFFFSFCSYWQNLDSQFVCWGPSTLPSQYLSPNKLWDNNMLLIKRVCGGAASWVVAIQARK